MNKKEYDKTYISEKRKQLDIHGLQQVTLIIEKSDYEKVMEFKKSFPGEKQKPGPKKKL